MQRIQQKYSALILAAGCGSRLNDLTKDYPKCLVKVNGREILDYQLLGYINGGIREENIYIVVGYRYEMICAFLQHKYPKVNVIYNLKEEFNWVFNSEILGDGEYRAIKDMILERLATVYDIKTYDELDYIYNLYEVDIDFDYANEYNINEYVYKVKLILK